MTDALQVSVIIPTHKRSLQLKRAIESALNQSYNCAEIIVVSDGFDQSTDELMLSIQKNQKNIVYKVVDPPQGGNHARNVGAMTASSEFLAFLDDDDEWHNEKIERQMAIFTNDSEIGLVCTAYNSVFVDTGKTIQFVPKALHDNSKHILFGNNIGSTTSVVLKRSIFIKAGMFDEELKAMQDYEMWIRTCQISKVGVVSIPSVQYYNDSSVAQISNNTSKYIDAYQHILKKHANLFKQKLSESEYRKRYSSMMITISKKAMRNSEPKIARDYALKAVRNGGYFDGFLCFVLSLVPYKNLIKAKSVVSRMLGK